MMRAAKHYILLTVLLLLSSLNIVVTAQESTPEQTALRRIQQALKTDASTLDLSALDLRNIPDEIKHLSTLKSLDLSGNSFEVLPEFIGRLHALQHLNLSMNYLVRIPPEIGQLQELRTLDLTGTPLTVYDLPHEITYLDHLEK